MVQIGENTFLDFRQKSLVILLVFVVKWLIYRSAETAIRVMLFSIFVVQLQVDGCNCSNSHLVNLVLFIFNIVQKRTCSASTFLNLVTLVKYDIIQLHCHQQINQTQRFWTERLSLFSHDKFNCMIFCSAQY